MSMFDFGADGETGPSIQTDILGSESADLTCQFVGVDGACTVPLFYGGRGRRPVYCADHKGGRDRTESSSSRTNTSSNPRRKSGAVPERELEQACNNLNTLYQSLLMPLMLVSQDGAKVWSDQIDSLDKSNHTFLANNKKLVRQINDKGEKSGTVGFVLAHLFAITPVMLVAYADVTHRRRAARPTPSAPSPAYDGAEFIDVDLVPPGEENPDAPVYDIDAAFRR